MHYSWKPHLEPLREIAFDATLRVHAEIAAGKRIYPAMNKRFAAFEMPFRDIKVVIIGQDPYHGEGQANGLAFSVNNGTPFPPSLKNIFVELKSDVHCLVSTGDLTCWTNQGVLLLNSSLSVEESRPASHSDFGWHQFTRGVLEVIAEQRKDVCFVLWGSHAKNLVKGIDFTNHYVIASAHPSPLSANRGFFGSKPFSKINNYLLSRGKEPINWRVS